MGVSEQAKNPAGRSPSRLEMIMAQAMRFRIIAAKMARGNRCCHFGPDANLNARVAGRGPVMSGGRTAEAKKTRVSTDVTCPRQSRNVI